VIAAKKPEKKPAKKARKPARKKPAGKKKPAKKAAVPLAVIVPAPEYPIVLVEPAAQKGFYRKLRVRMRRWIKSRSGRAHKWAKVLMLAPDLFHLLCRLMVEKDVPVAEKVRLGMVIAYFVSPLDLLPEAIFGPVAFVDDIALSAWVLHRMLNVVDPEVIRRNWAGDGDVLEVIRETVQAADKMMAGGLWKRLKSIFK